MPVVRELDLFGLMIGEFDGEVNSGPLTGLVGQLTDLASQLSPFTDLVGQLTDLVGQLSPFIDLVRQRFSLSTDQKLMIINN